MYQILLYAEMLIYILPLILGQLVVADFGEFSATKSSTAQNEGLYNFYTALGGAHWVYSPVDVPWAFDGDAHDPCTEGWAGVGCNGTDGGACNPGECVVTSIVLEEHNLTGSIPTTYAGLEELSVLDIGYNSIYGIIPDELGQLAKLTSLSIGVNSLVGRLPPCVDGLRALRELDAIGNSLTGPIPAFANSIDTMQNIYLGENLLTGPIPATIPMMTNLEYMYFTKNRINGTIPDAIGTNLTRLYYLGLSTNCLEGPLPAAVGSLQELRYMMLNGNKLTGTIPKSIGKLTNLEFFEANYNAFTGPIPSVFGSLVNLFAVEICDNFINGTLPAALGSLTELDTLYLDANYITGPVPSEFGSLQSLTGLLMYDNLLTGPIPPELGRLSLLEELSLYKNRLTGYIPDSVTKMTRLKELVLQNNGLRGFECLQSDGCEFNMPLLQRLDVSDNRLDGTVPRQIFHLPSLRSVALVNGCFHGELTEDICVATNLEVLSLDGLTSGPNCRKDTYNPLGLQSGYIVRHYMSGSLPQCVWHMPNLTVLHVAGNGLGGSLPSDLPADSKLLNVSIAYNRFTGTIPDRIQSFKFVELCLAYNKLSGDLSSSSHVPHVLSVHNMATAEDTHALPAGSIVSVEVNRLTGYTPGDFELVGTLDALNGNFFDCDRHHRLPGNDEQSNYYICGSKNLDQSLMAWATVISLLGVFVGTVLVVQCRRVPKNRSSVVSANMDTIEEEDECNEMDADATRERLLDDSLSMHTAPGSFDANMSEDSLLGRPSRRVKKEYIYNYGASGSLSKLKAWFSSLWDSLTDVILLWILWFEETTKDSSGSLPAASPTKTAGSASVDHGGGLRDLKVFVSLLCMIRRSSLLITGLIVVFCVPLYLMLKLVWGNEYSTHEHQYGWLISCAFLSGILPAVCLLVVFLALCCVLAYSLVMLYPASVGDAMRYVRLSMLSFPRDSAHISMTLASAADPMTGSSASGVSSPGNSLNQSSFADLMRGSSHSALPRKPLLTGVGAKQLVAFSLLFVLNVAITLSINGLYVYGFDTSTHYYVKVSMKVVLAMFQIAWNLIVIPKTVEYVAHLVHDSSSRVKWLMTLCLSFNYIIAPAMAALLSSSTCFADYFKDQPSVNSFYEYDICRAFSLDVTTNERYCTELTTAAFSTSFIPPFMYNYQCASTLITSYVPILMLEHAILVVIPLAVVGLLSFEASAKYVPDLFIRIVPAIVWPPQYRPAMTERKDFTGALMRPDRMIAAFMSHFVVLVTYGLASPYLAVAICVAMCTLTTLAQVLIGRYICFYRSRSSDVISAITSSPKRERSSRAELQPLALLNVICAGILDGLPSCLWTILCIAPLFMSAIISDVASDKVSWTLGVFVGVPTFLAPLLAYATLKATLHASSAQQ